MCRAPNEAPFLSGNVIMGQEVANDGVSKPYVIG